MRTHTTSQILWLGLIFHVAYIYSVFDCYFTSPVVHGMQQHRISWPRNAPKKAPAKRVVLIVGDGLRADLLFNVNPFPNIPDSPLTVAPFLRSVASERGAFGISHTRVPTESRPGRRFGGHKRSVGKQSHFCASLTSLLSTKAGKPIPYACAFQKFCLHGLIPISQVDFDSVFNKSAHTFAYGSPDIVPMFARGVTPEDKVSSWCYDEEDEDFTKDAKELDTWVLTRLRETFQNATQHPGSALDRSLRQEGVVIFLHLLGLDTTGHSYRPFSKEYMQNIIHVDAIVQEAEKLINDFYAHDDEPENESRTAYVFTADHGMSVIGNHGDGGECSHPDNTRTPLIVWGSGVRGPVSDPKPNSTHDSYSKPAWGQPLTDLARADVQQADVAALMTALLGVDWPMNSVGVVPGLVQGPGYLKESDKRGDEQMARIGVFKLGALNPDGSAIKSKHHLRYKSFPPLEPYAGGALPPGALELREIERLLAAQDWKAVRQRAQHLIDITLEGLVYLQRSYDRYVLRFIVTAGYIGWMLLSALHVLHTHVLPPNPVLKSTDDTGISVLDLLASMVSLFTVGIFAYQRSPWTYYLYAAFPIYFFRSILREGNAMYETLAQEMDWGTFPTPEEVLAWGIGSFAVLECMTLAYTHRELWTVLFVIIGVVWPVLSWPTGFYSQNKRLGLGWTISCLVSGIFTVLSVEKTESIFLISLGAGAILMLGLAGDLAMILVVAALVTTISSVRSLQNKEGLPILNQSAGWVILVLSVVLPIFLPPSVSSPSSKLQQYFLAFGPLFVLLSISTEGLFYASFSLTLFLWVEVEARLHQTAEKAGPKRIAPKPVTKNIGWRAEALRQALDEDESERPKVIKARAPRLSRGLAGADVRRALFFLFFVQVAFFGAAKSFYLEPVYRLIPVFNPFFMASLLIFKIVAPYVILSTMFATLNKRVALPSFALFKVALGLTDGNMITWCSWNITDKCDPHTVMSLTFFYLVRDTGSWLEIGQSISFYIITSLLLAWSAGICAAGDWLMKGSVLGDEVSGSTNRLDTSRKFD
ncbi:GPI ethanolamine phosphate transferase 1 [Rhizoctonia solani AG-1 IA]|uniref:GPI ethanolamine phosphate transferase 1 n=1 Tax=Thanatephorus cucumeris (strain AG1-IA) TaxID=983506 RepID=L8WLB0_THACA|nr:GPI ethanolamine phosphate transferase 1 [Rhizoctonia solani AG-1 IA]